MPCELAGQAVSTWPHAGTIVIVADDAVVARHERLSDRGQTQYNWEHYIPLVQRKLGTEQAQVKAWRIAPSLLRMDVAILNELGYRPFSQEGGALLFHLLSRLCQHTSVVIETNLDFAEWSKVCGGAKMATALLDRLPHYCHIVETGNESYVALSRLETTGEGSMRSYFKVLRALGGLDELSELVKPPPVSPYELLRLRGKKRERASSVHSRNREH